MDDIDVMVGRLDQATAERVRPALERLLGEPAAPMQLTSLTQFDVQSYLWVDLPRHHLEGAVENHETAWALGDLFELAGLDRYAALCRDRRTHEIIAGWRRDPEHGARLAEDAMRASPVVPPDVPDLEFGRVTGPQEAAAIRGASAHLEDGIVTGALDPELRGFRAAAQRRVEAYLHRPSRDFAGRMPLEAVRQERVDSWRASFRQVPGAFWERAVPAIRSAPAVPANAQLALAPVVALLEGVGEGVTLTEAGYLPTRLALALDERFGWSQEYALGRPRGEADVHQLRFIHEHLRAQRLLTRRGRQLTVSASGRRAVADPQRLWQAVVAPAPRWSPGFEQDALAVMASALLRGERLTFERVIDEMAYVLGTKWRPADRSSVDGAAYSMGVTWYRLGLPLGWFVERRLSSELRLSPAGRVAAACVFRAVSTAPMAH